MNYTKQELANILNIDMDWANNYLCRSEFSHIKLTRKNRKRIYENVADADIERLKILVRRSRWWEKQNNTYSANKT